MNFSNLLHWAVVFLIVALVSALFPVVAIPAREQAAS